MPTVLYTCFIFPKHVVDDEAFYQLAAKNILTSGQMGDLPKSGGWAFLIFLGYLFTGINNYVSIQISQFLGAGSIVGIFFLAFLLFHLILVSYHEGSRQPQRQHGRQRPKPVLRDAQRDVGGRCKSGRVGGRSRIIKGAGRCARGQGEHRIGMERQMAHLQQALVRLQIEVRRGGAGRAGLELVAAAARRCRPPAL